HQACPEMWPHQSFADTSGCLWEQKERRGENNCVVQELKKKDAETESIKEEYKKIKEELVSVQNVQEDYQAMMRIVDQAPKMAFLSEDDEKEKISFKMDKNRNLERVEKD